MPTDAQQTSLHNLLYKIQDQIARTGTCNSNDLKTANDALSSDGLNLNAKDAHGNSLKQIILGRNLWRKDESDLCLPPILPLLKHPQVEKNITDIDVNNICLVPLHQSDARVGIGIFLGGLILVGLPTGLAIGGIALGIGVIQGLALADLAGILSISAPISLGLAATGTALGAAGGVALATLTASEISQARKAGLQYMSGHSQFIDAMQTNNEILIDASLERLTNTQTPTKQQKMVVLAVIKQITDLNLRREILRIAVGESSQGTHAPLYQFFNYKRGLFAPSATRGTLKLLHGELKELEKDKKMLSTDAYTREILTKEQQKVTPAVVAKPVSTARAAVRIARAEERRFPAVPTAPLPVLEASNNEAERSTRVAMLS